MIHLKDVEKSYGASRVLRGITLDIDRGEFVSVMGSSGSGKSTLLNLIGGMDLADGGSVTVNGRDLSACTDDQLTIYRRQEVGFVFQFFNLLPNITVSENVRLPLLLNGDLSTERVLSELQRVGLTDKAGAYPHELSGGQHQRVAIARALVHNPAIILADEPTGSLDTENGEAVMGLLTGLASGSGKTIVLVTHEDYIARHAGRVLKIRDGRLS